MTEWNVIAADRRTANCPIALDLRDEFTSNGLVGDVELDLDLQHGTEWFPSERKPVKNRSGFHVYTGLGHAIDPATLPSFRVRIRIEADYYRPAFRAIDDGLEFNVPTYNDSIPPAVTPLMPLVVLMLPTAGYLFGGHVRVLHGRVIDAAGNPLADATLEADGIERAMTGNNGAFSLPLRWQDPSANVNVQVDHQRSGRSAAVVFTLPGDLQGNHDITVT